MKLSIFNILLFVGAAVGFVAFVYLLSNSGGSSDFDSSPSSTIEGTDKRDNLTGTAGDDVILGDRKDDNLTGLAGNDRLEGGSGEDVLFGGPGNDTLIGSTGDDVMNGGPGADQFDCDGGDENKIEDFNSSEGDTRTGDCVKNENEK